MFCLWSICDILLEKRNGIICETCKPFNFLKCSHPGFGICSGILSCMCSHIQALIGYSTWYLFQQPYLHNAWAAYAFNILHIMKSPCIVYYTVYNVWHWFLMCLCSQNVKNVLRLIITVIKIQQKIHISVGLIRGEIKHMIQVYKYIWIINGNLWPVTNPHAFQNVQ